MMTPRRDLTKADGFECYIVQTVTKLRILKCRAALLNVRYHPDNSSHQ